ncbi:hypothetical protein ACROYT_G003865 [Oculina patagonica]
MSAFNALPELILSKNCAKYLMTRNAGEKALFKKQCWLMDKAKTKEEKAFVRERERLLQRRQTIMKEVTQTPQPCDRVSVVKKISQTEAAESDKWEIQSDTPCYTKQRRKQGVSLGSKPLWSSHESLLSVASSNQSDTVRETAVSQQSSPRSLRSWSCVLPPISIQRTNSARKYTT